MNNLSSSSYRRQSAGFLKKLKLVTLNHESVHDYREIVASQSGFDSYDEMYYPGYRIGNSYDK